MKRLSSMAAAAALLALLATGPTAAHAAAPAARHCAVVLAKHNMTPLRQACFDTFTAAVAFGTGGRITNAPNDVTRALADPALTSVAPNSGVPETLLSIEYDADQYRGASSSQFGVDGPCTDTVGDVEYGAWNVGFNFSPPPGQPQTWWNDRITSFQTFSNCWADHFAADFWQGAHTGFLPSTPNIGPAFNDQTTSIEWS